MPRGKADGRVRAGLATKSAIKSAVKPARKSAHESAQKPAPERRSRAPAEAAKTAHRPKSLDAMVLAAEVERLEQELAAARARLVELEARADRDPLTDLPNRRTFERELARSLAYVKRHGTSAALLYLDLDAFKHINDCYGHAAGDTMLRAVSSVLGRHVRESDIVARIGGDEFALLLWNCDEASAVMKAQALETAVGRTTAMHDGATLAVGASVGAAALLPLDHPAETIARADRAMYGRKAARRAESLLDMSLLDMPSLDKPSLE